MILPAAPPLVPTPDDARDQLRRELLRPEYSTRNPLQRLLDWVSGHVGRTVDHAGQVPPLQWLAGTAVVLVVVLVVAWAVSRTRLTARTRTRRGDVLTGERVTAEELRRRARAALEAGRYGDAVVEAFRALALAQVERGRLDDDPGATADEVARSLAREFPELAEPVGRAARTFDGVLYGGRDADVEQARELLDLDARLAVAR